MAQQPQFKERPKSILDDIRYRLWGEKPVEGSDKIPSASLYVNSNGQPTFMVYLNNGDKYKNNIQIPFNVGTFNAFIETFKDAVRDKDNRKYSIQFHDYVWFNDKENPGKRKRSDEKKLIATLEIGRDKNTGTVYLGVIKYNYPSVRFLFGGIRDCEILINGEKPSSYDLSTMWARAWIEGISEQYHKVATENWKEPKPRETKPSGNSNNNSSYGGQDEGFGNADFDDNW